MSEDFSLCLSLLIWKMGVTATPFVKFAGRIKFVDNCKAHARCVCCCDQEATASASCVLKVSQFEGNTAYAPGQRGQ